MRPMPRVRTAAKWAGGVVCAGIAGVVVLTSWDPMSAQNRDVEAVVSCGHVFVARTPDMSWMFLFAPAKGTAITKAELNEAIKRATREMDANSVISAVQGRGGSWIPRWDYLSGYW